MLCSILNYTLNCIKCVYERLERSNTFLKTIQLYTHTTHTHILSIVRTAVSLLNAIFTLKCHNTFCVLLNLISDRN